MVVYFVSLKKTGPFSKLKAYFDYFINSFAKQEYSTDVVLEIL